MVLKTDKYETHLPSGERRMQLGRGFSPAGTTVLTLPVATSIAASVALFSRMKWAIRCSGVAVLPADEPAASTLLE